jgi:hypothetical protein
VKTLRFAGLGVKVAASGGRASVVRLALMAGGIGAGVALLLGATAVAHAIQARDDRELARVANTYLQPHQRPPADATLEWPLATEFEGRDVLLIAVQRIGRGPIPPGLPRVPSPGEAFVSPALRAMLEGRDGSLLAARVPGRIAGPLGPAGLLDPAEAVGYVGAPAWLRSHPTDAVVIAARPRDVVSGQVSEAPLVMLSIAAVAILFPIALFVLTATKLSAATRETRLAAIRLAGATGAQLRALAAIETALVAVLGCVGGGGVFLLARRGAAGLPAVRSRWFPSDLSVPPLVWAAVLVAVPLFAFAVSSLGMRRLIVTPLGIVRRARRGRRGAHWPAVAGLGFLVLGTAAAWRDRVTAMASPLPGVIVLGGLGLVLVGLAGTAPWLGWQAGRAVASWAPSPSTLLGARRLEADPTSTGRVVMGIAVLVALLGVGQAAVLADARDSAGLGEGYLAPWVSHLPATAIIANDYGPRPRHDFERLNGVPGVVSVTLTHKEVNGGENARSATAIISSDGSQAALERVRTALEWRAYDVQSVGLLRRTVSRASQQEAVIAGVAQAVAIIMLMVTAASLLVSTVDGMMERRRPIAVLSALGVPAGVIRRSVMLQIVLPLCIALALGVAVALAVTVLVFRILKEPLLLPLGPLALTAAAVGGAVLIVTASALPWVRVTRRPELLRTE